MFASFFPNPRFRFYGSPGNYFRAAADLALGRIHKGDHRQRLEESIRNLHESAHAISMPQERTGIYLALKASLGKRRKVVLSPYTIYDVINMVISAGGIPVFADIERETCNINAAEVERLVDDETGAVLVTHLHGMACDVAPIAKLCQEKDILLFEDCAQAFGTKINGQAVGTFGKAGFFSFGMAKNINSFYGGMMITDDDALAKRIRDTMEGFEEQETGTLLKRAFFCLVGDILTYSPVFWAFTFWVFRYGYLHNVEALNKRVRGEDDPVLHQDIPDHYLRRLTPMQARLLLPQLPKIESDARVRIEYARLYESGLSGIPELITPPFRQDLSHTYLAYPIQVPDLHGLLRYLMINRRDLSVQHISNCADATCFKPFFNDCPKARITAGQVLLLPIYPGYGRDNLERNVELIRRYFGVT